MNSYLILIRGVNVGGKNKMPMADLKNVLENMGFQNVRTYIASGNVIVQSNKSAQDIQSIIETALPKYFKLDSELIRVLVLSRQQLQAVVRHKPEGFGDTAGKYHSDVIFLMGIPVAEAMAVFDPREGVDVVWPGDSVIYSQRLSAERTKSRLSKIIGTKPYKSMTIRTWNTVQKLLELLEDHDK